MIFLKADLHVVNRRVRDTLKTTGSGMVGGKNVSKGFPGKVNKKRKG